MAELDHAKVAAMYLSLRCMELALIGAGVAGRIEHTCELKVRNNKKAMQSPGIEEWCTESKNKKVQFNKYNVLMWYLEVHFNWVRRFAYLHG